MEANISIIVFYFQLYFWLFIYVLDWLTRRLFKHIKSIYRLSAADIVKKKIFATDLKSKIMRNILHYNCDLLGRMISERRGLSENRSSCSSVAEEKTEKSWTQEKTTPWPVCLASDTYVICARIITSARLCQQVTSLEATMYTARRYSHAETYTRALYSE